MKLNAYEFLALDEVMNHVSDFDKLELVEMAKNGERVDGWHNEVTVEDIVARLEVSVNAAKGYIASLAKKDLIECTDPEEDYDMICITKEGVLEWDAR